MSNKPNFCSNCGEKLDTNAEIDVCPKCHTARHEHPEHKEPEHKQPKPEKLRKYKEWIILGVILAIAIPIIIIALEGINDYNDQVTQTYNTDPISDCNGQMDSAKNLAQSWLLRWTAATQDQGGQLRVEGRAISEEAANLLNRCSDFLDDQSRTFLSQIQTVILAQIENNIDYGPPCDPQCEPGPPIT